MKTKVKQIQKNKNLIEGNFFKNIIVFSLPLILSNVLQVLFNMADIAIVGQFDPNGKYLVGAIGSTSMLISLFTGFLIGIGGGINAVIAKDIGRRDAEDIQKGVHSGFLISVIAGFVIVAIGVPCARAVLMLLKTKSALLDDATMYLQIYLLGMPALAVYNHGNGVLAAQGETRRPLIYLTVAGVLNVGLDILFVVVFNIGAAGVALASIIAQYSSAILVFVDLLRSKGAAKFSFKKLTFGGATGKSIAILGISAGLQNSIFAIANMFLQSAVNKFDELTVSGNSAAANIDSLCYNMLNAFYMACTTFMGQSFGAGDRKKVKKSYVISLSYGVILATLFGVAMLVFGRYMITIFSPDEAVIEAGMRHLRIMAFSLWLAPFMDCTIAASRGIGKSLAPTAIVIMGSCVFRIVWIYTVFARFGTFESLYLLYPVSWGITALAEIIYFAIAYRKTMKACGLV